jgi:hypothetical protein
MISLRRLPPFSVNESGLSIKADDRAFVLNNWTAGYGAEPTHERPNVACERRFVETQGHSALRSGSTSPIST